jgi:ABC-type phosphate transport system permease subunit
MIGRGRISLWLLALLVGAPPALLLGRSVYLFRPRTPVVLALADGRRILSMPLPSDPFRADETCSRMLRSDGVVEVFDRSSILDRTPAPDAWTFRTDDGRLRLGWIQGLVVPEGDTLRGAQWLERIGGMRDELERDRRERLAELGHARRTDQALSARSRWRLFIRMEAKTGLILREADGSTGFLGLSSVRQMDRAPATSFAELLDWARRIFLALSDSSDRWGGGGLWQAGLSTMVLILLAGSVGGTLALLAALLLSERLRPGRWARVVRRTSGWLAAVPGIVWGAVGFGLLVPVFGGRLDGLTGSDERWSNGGMLWSALTLGILAAPLSLRRALDVLDTVPRQWRRLARSCGATRWQVLRMVVLPASWRGLFGAWLSAFARAAGETAPLLLVGAIHSNGGFLTPVGESGLSLSGGFLHLGAMACDPVWSDMESAMGYPTAHLALLVLTVYCIGFELLAAGFLGRGRRALREEIVA